MSATANAGGFVLRDEDFTRIADIVHGEVGICLPSSKQTLVYARLVKRLRRLGLRDFGDYCDLVVTPDGASERQQMIAALTTNLTRFFREPHHFEHLRRDVLARATGRTRLWSAACSSGQEAYSMALCVLEEWPDVASRDIRILATDIDPGMLETASAGIFAEEALAGVPAPLRDRWFAREGGGRWRALPVLRGLIDFRLLNLIGDWPMRGRFQAIFCRNVAIYFDQPTQERLWSRLAGRLERDGLLYIGHSERVTGDAAQLLRGDGVTAYRLVAKAAVP